MKVIAKKSFTVTLLAPETEEEKKQTEKIIREVLEEDQKPFRAEEWTIKEKP